MNRRLALFLLLYLAVILYLSLYPWRFLASRGPANFYWIPLSARGTTLDAFLNVVFYVPLGAAAFVFFRRGAAGFLAALALGTLLSFGVEWAQLSIPHRFGGSLNDLASNSLGTLLGIVIVLIADSPPLASRLRVFDRRGTLLLGLWALWQAFLFLPGFGPRLDATHIVAGLIALSLAMVRRNTRLAAPLLLIWLLLDELRPFRFQGSFRSPAQPFWWLPFESWFAEAADTYYATFFEKLFFYTAILHLERKAGMHWIRALAVPAAILFAGELAQCYLPGRTPETTDLFLLAAGAVLLNLSEQTSAASNNKEQA